MNSRNKLKILNDPIYGFITIPNERIFDIIEHKYFQRLRRISQMGMSYLVYPGAQHTRFHHALGCMHLMRKSLEVLRFKGVKISEKEEEALLIAILLHDIGHGPFSHAMEHSIVSGVSHEWLSLQFMEKMNAEFNQSLTLAIQIFKGEYHRKFFKQLIASQLDVDRLDYLKRVCSFGKINSFVDVHINEQLPLKIVYDFDILEKEEDESGHFEVEKKNYIKFYIAPKLDDDEF